MKLSQWLIAVVMLSGMAVFVTLPFIVFTALQSVALLVLWTIFSLVFTALILKYSIRFMRIGEMVLVSCFGNIYDLFSPQIRGKNGTADTGVLATVPFITFRQILPTGAFLIYMKSSVANTKQDPQDPTAEVEVFANIQLELRQDKATLDRLMHLMTGAGKISNFIEHSDTQETYELMADRITIETKKEPCLAITRFLRTLLQNAFNEAVGQSIPWFTLQECLKERATIQDKMHEILATEGTVFYNKQLRDCFDDFDITVVGILPTNAIRTAIAKRSIAMREGQANIVTAEAEASVRQIEANATAKALTTVALAVMQPGGEKVLAAETIAKMQNVQLITGLNPLEAGMSLLAAGGGKQQTPPPTPPPTP